MTNYIIESVLASVRSTKESLGEEPFAPMLHYHLQNKHKGLIALVPGENIWSMVAKICLALYNEMGPADWIAFSTDSYGKHFENEADGYDLGPGELEERFNNGDPTVVELMTVILVDSDLNVSTMSQVYRHLHTGEWEWETPRSEKDREVGGNVGEVIQGFFVYQSVVERKKHEKE